MRGTTEPRIQGAARFFTDIDNPKPRDTGGDVTSLLVRWNEGDSSALGELIATVYDYLHRIAGRSMRSERQAHTLQSTALIHEAFLRLAGSEPPQWRDRNHFFAVAARLMRHILVDYARRRQTTRRGGDWQRVPLDDPQPTSNMPAIDLLVLDEALTRLAGVDERKARVIELRFFGGLTVEETAAVLSVSAPTVILDTRLAKAWLLVRFGGGRDGD